MQGNGPPPATSFDLFDQLPDPIVVIDGGGLVVRGNRAAEQIMGRPADDFMGSSGLDLVHPDDLQLAGLSLASIGGKEVGTPIELRIMTGDGWRLVEIVGAPLDDGHIALSMRDLTDRRRWEVAGGDIARFQSLVQHATSITMLLHGDGVVASVSGAITRVLGHDPEHACRSLPSPMGISLGCASLRGFESAAAALHEADICMLANKQHRHRSSTAGAGNAITRNDDRPSVAQLP